VKNFHAWFKKRRIGVLMGGPSAEREISLKTGRAIHQSLRRQGYAVIPIDAGTDLPAQLKRARINFAYIALHGPGGEDGVVQGLLDWLKIPYTGSGVLASSMAMDKTVSKRIFAAAGLPIARGFDIERRVFLQNEKKYWKQAKKIGFPVVVKPATQGSAIGVSIVKTRKDWALALKTGFKYDDVLLIEKYLDGVEITVGILGHHVLPIIEILPVAGAFYDFKSKYAPGGSRHILPARISPSQAKKSAVLSLAACRALGTRGVARVDLIVDKKQGPTLLEVNTIPGMTQTSLLPDAARAAGIDFDALVLRIAEASIAG